LRRFHQITRDMREREAKLEDKVSRLEKENARLNEMVFPIQP
jgi:hypothetical protein